MFYIYKNLTQNYPLIFHDNTEEIFEKQLILIQINTVA